MRRASILIVAVASALLGPRLTAPHDRPAGTVFAYEPPDGFVRVGRVGAREDGPRDDGPDVQGEWTHAVTPGRALAARVTLKLLHKGGDVEAHELAVIADGMSAVLAPSGVSWTTLREETRTRADGAHVGLIEGECTRRNDADAGTGALPVTYRRLVLVFPTDDGTALVTALYGKDDVATWQPAFEATIGTARGVALRVPAAPAWMIVAWGGAGLVLAWLGVSLLGKRRDATPEPST